jgi:hypothetical protein
MLTILDNLESQVAVQELSAEEFTPLEPFMPVFRKKFPVLRRLLEEHWIRQAAFKALRPFAQLPKTKICVPEKNEILKQLQILEANFAASNYRPLSEAEYGILIALDLFTVDAEHFPVILGQMRVYKEAHE